MIAAARANERPARIERPRSVRNATHRRKTRAARLRHASIMRVLGGVFAISTLLMAYVVLTSSLTGLSYAVARASAQREALQEQTIRLEDRVDALRSDGRLADIAVRLGMREPQRFAVVHLDVPRVAVARSHFPILSSLAGFLAPAIAAKP